MVQISASFSMKLLFSAYISHEYYFTVFNSVTRDIVLPANCTVVVGIYKLHRRPDIYPNPEKFNPDNFLPENTTARNFYSFIPFSAGLRSCVGKPIFHYVKS